MRCVLVPGALARLNDDGVDGVGLGPHSIQPKTTSSTLHLDLDLLVK